jgi:hypothetical protein
VIKAEPMTLGRAVGRGFRYVVPAADERSTAQAVDAAANALHYQLAPAASPNYITCTPYSTSNSGSYSVYNNQRVYYVVRYNVNDACSAYGFQDRTQESEGPPPYPNVDHYWDKSCVNTTQSSGDGCTSRSCIAIPYQPTWTTYYNISAQVPLGSWYYNHSYNNRYCSSFTGTHYYGYAQITG